MFKKYFVSGELKMVKDSRKIRKKLKGGNVLEAGDLLAESQEEKAKGKREEEEENHGMD